MKKDTSYFSHDYNASQDVKMLFLRSQLGMEGSGIFWFLIEYLASSGGRLPFKIVPVLAIQMQVTEVKVMAVIQSFELFVIDGDEFYSDRLNRHLEVRKTLSDKGKEGVRIREEKKLTSSNASIPQLSHPSSDALSLPLSHPSSPPSSKESKVKEIKGKENKVIKMNADAEASHTHTQEDIEKFKSFSDWIDINTPRIQQFKQPFTIPEYLRLLEDFDKQLISKTLLAMQNRADVTKKNLSANLTLRNWIARDTGSPKKTEIESKSRNIPISEVDWKMQKTLRAL